MAQQEELEKDYEVIFPKKGDFQLLSETSFLIKTNADIGLMLYKDVSALEIMAENQLLAILISPEREVVASAGIAMQFPDETQEFGTWAVKPELQQQGLGKKVFIELFNKITVPKKIIALGNQNSGPILEKFGAIILREKDVCKEVFEPCKTCNCKKHNLPQGRKCVDIIFDLMPAIKKYVTVKNTYEK